MKIMDRLLARWFDYSARHHLKHRLRTFDYKFIAALAALLIAILLVIRYAG